MAAVPVAAVAAGGIVTASMAPLSTDKWATGVKTRKWTRRDGSGREQRYVRYVAGI